MNDEEKIINFYPMLLKTGINITIDNDRIIEQLLNYIHRCSKGMISITLLNVSKYIAEEKANLTSQILKEVRIVMPHIQEHELKTHSHLLELLLDSISETLLTNRTGDTLSGMQYDEDSIFFSDNIPLSEVVAALSHFRITLLQIIRGKFYPNVIDEKLLLDVYEHVVSIFDESIRVTTLKFNQDQKNRLLELNKEILELSAPLVPIKDGISVLPLIGAYTDERSQYIIEDVLPQISQGEIETLIIDFSGIVNMDTYVVKNLIDIQSMLSLLGVEPILTGIRPETALSITQLGVNLSEIRMHNTVKKALASLE